MPKKYLPIYLSFLEQLLMKFCDYGFCLFFCRQLKSLVFLIFLSNVTTIFSISTPFKSMKKLLGLPFPAQVFFDIQWLPFENGQSPFYEVNEVTLTGQKPTLNFC